MFSEVKDKTIIKYDSNIPRYTSYPTAPHFKSLDEKNYIDWLKVLPKNEDLSLYFHIPFCKQLCHYCGCYTKITNRYAPIEDYTHILTREIAIISELIAEQNLQVSHIHFGGGSPTILLPETFEYLFKTIRRQFNIKKNAQIAIEVDPRTMNEEKVISYAKMGVNRVSIGVQDFNHDVQIAINREQSFDLVYDTIKLFRKYDISDVNLDLIYGLPKQTSELIAKNIDYAMLLKPTRIALFSYAHVPWIKKHMRLINEDDIPDSLSKISMYKVAVHKLKQEGFIQAGLDHFAKEDSDMSEFLKQKKLKRNFQGYTTDEANSLIGFGVSSIGYLSEGYTQNTSNLKDYKDSIINNQLPVIKGFKINKDDKIRKTIIEQLMCYLEVDLNQICKSFDCSRDYFENEVSSLESLQKDGLLKVNNNKIKINPNAPQISRVASCVFDKYFKINSKKHSRSI